MVSWGGRERNAGLSLNIAISYIGINFSKNMERNPLLFVYIK